MKCSIHKFWLYFPCYILLLLLVGHYRLHPTPDFDHKMMQANLKVVISSSHIDSDEFVASLATSLSNIDGVQTTLHSTHVFQEGSKGLASIIRSLDWKIPPRFVTGAFPLTQNATADVLIATDCIQHLQGNFVAYDMMFSSTRTRLYCVVKNPKQVRKDTTTFEKLKPWITSQRLRILSPSEHLSHVLRDEWGHLALLTPISVMAPVFRLSQEMLANNGEANINVVAERIAILGSTSSMALESKDDPFINLLSNFSQARLEALHKSWRGARGVILGGAATSDLNGLPEYLERRFGDTSFLSTYEEVLDSSALVTLLSDQDEALGDSQNHATALTASLVTGTPLVMDEVMLERNPHFSRDAVILVRSGENHMQAAFRQLSYPALSQVRKKQNVISLQTTMLLQNTFKLQQALRRDLGHMCP